MPVHNKDIKRIFNEVADILDIKGANPFRVRAYRNAAGTIGNLGRNVRDMINEGRDLSKLSGIGQDLADKINEILETGELSLLNRLKKDFPEGLTNLLEVKGLGPKKVQKLYNTLNVESAKDLEEAAENNLIRELEGFGKKTEENIIENLQSFVEGEKRWMLGDVQEVADSLISYIQESDKIDKVTIAGSYRRRKETIGDLDILVTCSDNKAVMDHFTSYEDVVDVVSKGNTRSTVILKSNLQVDLRVVAIESYGAALHYFTGSKNHNVAVRKMGINKGLKYNEYGVFKDEERIAGKTEEEVYAQVGLPYIQPELRENRGEIEAAQSNSLPSLITLNDLKGDMHMHTKETDGHDTLEEMVEKAIRLGYEYISITDHTKRVSVAEGMDADRINEYIKRIERINRKYEDITVLKGAEVDILKDGTLDLPDEILKKLDIRVCAVHYYTNLTAEEQTDRIIKALKNPYFNVLAHPTGRLINKRKPYRVDIEKVIDAAKDHGCFMELDSHPERLDLNDIHCKLAKDKGVKVVISTDAHSTAELELIKYGIGQARRGWLEKADVLNTKKWKQINKLIQKRLK